MNTDKLTKTARELESMIGGEQLAALAASAGGQSLSISRKGEKPEHVAITDDAWRQIQAHYSGNKIYFPKCQKAVTHGRNTVIRRQRAAGLPVNLLARKYGLSDRQIMQICSDLIDERQTDIFEPTPAPQTDLFDTG